MPWEGFENEHAVRRGEENGSGELAMPHSQKISAFDNIFRNFIFLSSNIDLLSNIPLITDAVQL
jgi:hypothetical protein